MKKYRLHYKNEGIWTKWSVVDIKNKVMFVGKLKQCKNWLKRHIHKCSLKEDGK